MLCDLKIGYGQTLVLTGGSAVKQSLVRACHMLYIVICIGERRISDCPAPVIVTRAQLLSQFWKLQISFTRR